MLNELLFETPWWLPTLIIALGAFVFVAGNRRQEKRIIYPGLGLALLGIAVALLSYFVETDKERSVRRTRELVAAVDHRDWPKFRSLIDPKSSVYGIRGPEAITQAVQLGAERYNVANLHITGLDVDKADTIITVTIRVLSDQTGGSGISDSQLQYQDFGDGWQLYEVKALTNQQISEERIRREISRR